MVMQSYSGVFDKVPTNLLLVLVLLRSPKRILELLRLLGSGLCRRAVLLIGVVSVEISEAITRVGAHVLLLAESKHMLLLSVLLLGHRDRGRSRRGNGGCRGEIKVQQVNGRGGGRRSHGCGCATGLFSGGGSCGRTTHRGSSAAGFRCCGLSCPIWRRNRSSHELLVFVFISDVSLYHSNIVVAIGLLYM